MRTNPAPSAVPSESALAQTNSAESRRSTERGEKPCALCRRSLRGRLTICLLLRKAGLAVSSLAHEEWCAMISLARALAVRCFLAFAFAKCASWLRGRRMPLTGVTATLVASGLAALVPLLLPASAPAFTGSNPIADTAQWSSKVWPGLDSAALTIPTEVDSSGLAPSVSTIERIYKAEQVVGKIPALQTGDFIGLCTSGVAATVGCEAAAGAGALYLGWEIGSGIRRTFLAWTGWGDTNTQVADATNVTLTGYVYTQTASAGVWTGTPASVCISSPCWWAETTAATAGALSYSCTPRWRTSHGGSM